MNDDRSRLYVPKADATARLCAQVNHGKETRQAIERATTANDLDALRSRLSRWSQRNEQVLAATFGQQEREAYRSAGLPRVTVRGFSARQARMGLVITSRLEYLESAVVRVGLAAEQGAHPAVDGKPWWRVMLDHPWTIALAAPVIVAPLITFITLAVTGGGAVSTPLAGLVSCESGRPVAGVWIAASAGQSDSGLAHLGPSNPSAVNYPAGSMASYSYLLSHGATYAVHVGCGSTGSAWDSSNYSPLLSGQKENLRCDDPPTGRGACVVVSG